MSHKVRLIPIGIALGFSCVACTGGEGASSAPSSTASSPDQPSGLRDAPEISVSGDPFAELDDARPSAERRAIGELHKGGERLIAYTEGGRCGLLVTRSGNEKGPVLSLDTAMPKSDDQGSSKMPAGPYLKSSATGSGASKPWASMSCGKNAMVIEYSSHGTGNPSKPRGSVSTAEGPEGSHSLFVAVGEEGARKKILSALPPGP